MKNKTKQSIGFLCAKESIGNMIGQKGTFEIPLIDCVYVCDVGGVEMLIECVSIFYSDEV